MSPASALAHAAMKASVSELAAHGLHVRLKNTFLEFSEAPPMYSGAALRSKSVDSPHDSRSVSEMTPTTATTPTTPTTPKSREAEELRVPSEELIGTHELNYQNLSMHPYDRLDESSYMPADEGRQLSLKNQKRLWRAPNTAEDSQMVAPATTVAQHGGKTRAERKELRASRRNHGAAAAAGPPTTLMIRGVPCRFTPEEVTAFLDAMGFEGKFDFFYLPQDGRCKSNLGYAFINFVDPGAAADCQAKLEGKALGSSGSTKVCTLSRARIQGLADLERHFRRKAAFHTPMFLGNSQKQADELLEAPPQI